jgi:hypothetical protein
VASSPSGYGRIAIGGRKTGDTVQRAREGVVEFGEYRAIAHPASRRFGDCAIRRDYQIAHIALHLHLPLQGFDLFALRRRGAGPQHAQKERTVRPSVRQLAVIAVVTLERLHPHGNGAAERVLQIGRKRLFQLPVAGQQEDRNGDWNADPFPGCPRQTGRWCFRF